MVSDGFISKHLELPLQKEVYSSRFNRCESSVTLFITGTLDHANLNNFDCIFKVALWCFG